MAVAEGAVALMFEAEALGAGPFATSEEGQEALAGEGLDRVPGAAVGVGGTGGVVERGDEVDEVGGLVADAALGDDARPVGDEGGGGREARGEFDEDIEPEAADGKTMGNSILLQVRRAEEPVPFVPPAWAYRFKTPADVHDRLKQGVNGHNFWWLELGGLDDTIADAEEIRHELYRTAWGVWDYIKNHAPEREKAEHWAVEWVGSLPGKRENRRYVGDLTLTQNDIRAGAGRFDDLVAYGGWSMDDHHPAGLLFPGAPTIHHKAPSPYDIPWRCLYSADVPNLLCAGRNISVTHAALSSTRVMGTCALLGQAAGTGAAMCVERGVDPAELAGGGMLAELQARLMRDDVWLPGRRRPADALMRGAAVEAPGPAGRLTDGQDRDLPDRPGAYDGALNEPITFTFPEARPVGGLRLVCDSNLRDAKRLPATYPTAIRQQLPATLLRAWRVEALRDGSRWETVSETHDNHQRLVRLPLGVQARGLRFTPLATWGHDRCRLFGLEAMQTVKVALPHIEPQPFRDLVAAIPQTDLAAPAVREDAAARPISLIA